MKLNTPSLLMIRPSTLSVSADSVESAVEGLGVAQSAAELWFDTNRLLWNDAKTERVVFSLRALNDINGELYSVRFLEVQIVPKLSWNEHIDRVARRLNCGVYALRRLAECVSPAVLRTAYCALFHSAKA